jgi:DNA polymerase I-like protein with 3'-5' exonuclease and polymerase domains
MAQYGASARGIAYATGCTVEYAEEFLATEAKLFPQSIGFRQVIRDAVEVTGALPENMHREQSEDGRWTIYRRGYWQSPGGSRYSFRQYPKRVDGQQIMDYKDTQIANYGIQGEAFYLMAVSAGRVARWLLSQDFFRTEEFPQGRAFLINNVHDCLWLDCHEDVAREVALSVKSIMEDAPRYMSTYLGYNIGHVPFPAAAEMGSSTASLEHVH